MDFLSSTEQLCRICMNRSSELVSLYEEVEFEKYKGYLDFVFVKFTSIKLTKTDMYPHNICKKCCQKLIDAYLLREKCLDSQRKFEALLGNPLDNCILTQGTISSCGETKSGECNVTQINNETLNEDSSNGNDDFEDSFSNTAGHNFRPTNIAPMFECSQCNEEFNSLYALKKHEKSHMKTDQFCCKENKHGDNKYVTQIKIETIKDISKVNDNFDKHDFKPTNIATMFKCIECSQDFNCPYAFKKHEEAHSKIGKFCCEVCNKKFTRHSDVKRHMSAHTGIKPFTCILCHHSFTQSGTLANHMRKHNGYEGSKICAKNTDSIPHLCSVCGKSFKHSFSLTIHIRRHKGEKPYSCSDCHMSFVSNSRLKAHMRVHTGERPFFCKYCDKTFGHSTVLNKHLKCHLEEKPYSCSNCDKTFSSLDYLKIHKRIHTGEKPFKCHLCQKSFADPKNLKVHKRIHSGEKPFLCVTCGKIFRRSHHLKNHMSTHDKTKDEND